MFDVGENRIFGGAVEWVVVEGVVEAGVAVVVSDCLLHVFGEDDSC